MSENLFAVDMAGGANVLRCLADFIACRPGLPDLVSVRVLWSFTDHVWEIEGHLATDAAAEDVVRWGTALDDPVIASVERRGGYDGAYMLHEVTGTVHGHGVRIWGHLPIQGPA